MSLKIIREIKNELIMLGREFDKSDELIIILCFVAGMGFSFLTKDHGAFWILLYLMVTRGIDQRKRGG